MRKINILLVIGLFWACSPKYNQSPSSTPPTNSYKINTIAFYNLENLFDTINDPRKYDEASPLMQMPPEIRGEVYWKKVSNMAKVLSQIGAKKAQNSPAIIGVCEIENQAVLEDVINDPHLVKKHYGIVHYPGPDERSIDVALLYQKKLFTPISSSAHEVVLWERDDRNDRDYTRDVLLVTGVLDGDTLHIMVNHWPSRSGGEKASAPKRIKAATVVRHLADSIQAVNPYAKIIIMGDLNDNPYNKSVAEILDTKSQKENLDKGDLFNPMYNMLVKQGLGTLGYHDSWDLFDQIIISQPFLNGDYSAYQFYKAGIYNPSYLIDQHGPNKGYPFRSFSNGRFTGGYSDHLPVYIYIVKAAP